MARKTAVRREPSVIKGALAGLTGGIAGSAVKIAVQKIIPPRTAEQTSASLVLAERAAAHPLSEIEKRVRAHGRNWAFGAIAGAVYGVAVEMEPKAAAWSGAAFGLTLNRFTHESLLAKTGVIKPTTRQSTRERQSEWVSHAVYGVTTEMVRRLVRRGL
jgi:putative membrane protein